MTAVAERTIEVTPLSEREATALEFIAAYIADAVRALYNETCEALDDKAASLNEETHAAIEERRRRREGVDGECAGAARATDRSAEADPRLND
ncbi:MAG: hypothetical protein KF895_03135 [Parvibaculum sp.]|nr:hypothetical protein [Parvibaculum sp.]